MREPTQPPPGTTKPEPPPAPPAKTPTGGLALPEIVAALAALWGYVRQVHEEAQEAGNPGIDWSLAEVAAGHAWDALEAAGWKPREPDDVSDLFVTGDGAPRPQTGTFIHGQDDMQPAQAVPRFVVFMGDTCYPSGGWNDMAGGADTLDEAVAWAQKNIAGDWAHVVDLAKGKIVWQARVDYDTPPPRELKESSR